MNKNFGLIILFLISCDDQVNLARYCANKAPCWLPQGAENVQNNIIFDFNTEDYSNRGGFCNAGYTVCEEDNVRCEGVIYPKEEICDGADNDCNGIVDDPDKFWAGIANTKCYFEETGECRYSEQMCIDGQLICAYSTSPFYGPEVCDGKDNDCDGEYDEGVPQNFVYNGPYETANVGECKAGITLCESGQEKIFGMVLPITEVCNNGKDDDCDGITDEQEFGLPAVDYAFFIDFSGSMQGDRLDSVLESVCSFVNNPIFITSRFAMVGISVDTVGDISASTNNDDYGLHLISDFTDIGTACDRLETVMSEYVHSTSEELQLDAIIRSFGNYPTSLDWSSNQKRVYIFSDEPPQSINGIDLTQKINEVIEDCNINNFTLGVFTLPEFYTFGWQTLSDGCNGFLENIDNLSNQTYFENNFLSWFGGSC